MAGLLGRQACLGLPHTSSRTQPRPAARCVLPRLSPSAGAAAAQARQQCLCQQRQPWPCAGYQQSLRLQAHCRTSGQSVPHATPLSASRQRHAAQWCNTRHQRSWGSAAAAAADDPDTSASTSQQDAAAAADSAAGQPDSDQAAALRAQQLHDWGFSQVGETLPEGLSVNALAESLPPSVFQLDMRVAFGRVALSAGLMAAGYYWLWYMRMVCPLWQQALCWLAIGTGYFGVFVAATDAAHFALCPAAPVLQDVIGATLMAPSLWAFETWRLQYFNHLLCVNMLDEDTDAWHPLTVAELSTLSGLRLALTRLVMGTPLKLWASIGQWAQSWGGFDLQKHVTRARPWVLLSWAVPFAFMGVVWPSMLAAGGLGGWASWWLMPWLVFHGWLGLLTLVQHTAPFIPFQREGPEYDAAQAVLNGTVTLRLPRWLELLLHDANYHLPQHVSMDIPSYRLKQAHEALKQRVGRYMNETQLNGPLLLNLLMVWVAYDEEKGRYCSFDEASHAAEARLAAAAASSRGVAAANGSDGAEGLNGHAASAADGAQAPWQGAVGQAEGGVLLPQG